MAAGREDAALAVVRRAAKAIPGDEFVEAEADLYQREGQKLTKAGKWGEAIALAERGLKKVGDGPRKELTDYRNGLYLNWSNALAGKKEFEKALGVLAKGLTADPADDRLRNNAKVYALKQAEGLLAAGKDDDALAALRRAAKAVPGAADELLAAEADLYQREVAKLSKAAKWDAAVAFAERGLRKVAEKSRKELTDTRNGVYLNWSNAHVKAKEYEKALEVLRKATKADPEDGRFRNNAIAVYDSWAEPLMKKKDWAGAIKVYQKGLEQFPGDSHLTNNLQFCEQEMKKGK
jgi:tetratricopeptide (TPR) repeat protein